MKAVRRRLLTAATVLIAFALGVALGAGPLSKQADVLPGVPNRTSAADPAITAFEFGFVGATSGKALSGTLKGRNVALVSIEGADPNQVKAVADALKRAGARIVSQPTLTAKLTDPANRQFVDGVARQAALKVKGVADGVDSYGRIGTALARTLVGKSGSPADGVATTIWSAFDEGDLVTGDAPTIFADSAVFVVGGSRNRSVSTVVAELTRTIDAHAAGAVLAGPASSSLTNGAVAAVREGPSARALSTVDVTDSVAGPVVVAMALQRDLAKKSGAWGTPRSANGPLP